MDKLERVTWERRPVTGNNAHPVGFTLLFFILISLAIFGVLSALESGDSRWFTLFIAGVLSLYVLWWRVHEHDARAYIEQERTVTEAELPTPEIRNIKVFTNVSNGGNQIAVGEFSFNREQWHALKTVLFANNNRLIRDRVREARPHIFQPYDIEHWKETCEEFQRLGLIDSRQYLTETGKKFFRGDPFLRSSNPPAPNGNIAYATRYSDGGDGGENGEGDFE